MSYCYLAFDYGSHYIGIAIGQDVTKTARPLTTLKRIKNTIDWQAIKKIIATWSPQALIVGIPKEMPEHYRWMTTAAEDFAKKLAEKTQCMVHTVDERLSTIEAKETLFLKQGYRGLKKEAIDAMAASIILETWLRK